MAFSQKTASAPAGPPLAFEPNRGQTASEVMYLARSREGTVFLTRDGLVVSTAGNGSFQLRFENSSTAAKSVPEELLRSRSNYLDGRRQISGIENYGAVRYRDIYPGTDVRFYGREQHLEHDFVLAPGVNPETIILGLEGTDHLRIGANGNVEFTVGALNLGESSPVAWQIINGKRVPVEVTWRLLGKDRLGFSVGAYDRTHELTIDPVLAFSTHLGGATAQLENDNNIFTDQGRTAAQATAVDGAGNIYVAGFTSAVDFPLTAGSYDHAAKFPFFGGHDPNISSGMGFVSKFDKTGQTLIYSTYLGDLGIKFIAVDAAGQVYTLSDNQGDLTGGQGVVINKLNTEGSGLLYSFTFGGGPDTCLGAAGGNATASGIAVDDTGNAWIAGNTVNLCLPTTAGAFQTTAPNKLQSGFVTKLDTSKTGAPSIVYSTYLGGSFSDLLSALAVDSAGNAYLTGSTSSADFPHSAMLGTDTSALTFVSKLSADGSRLIFSTLLQGGFASKIALDSSSDVYVSGVTDSIAFPTTANALRKIPTGECDFTPPGPCWDVFVTKLNPSGDVLIYSTLLGGLDSDFVSGLRINAAGAAFITGTTNSTDFPVTPDAFRKNPAFFVTGYLTELAADGGSISYSTLLSGWTIGITLDSTGNPYLVGGTTDWAMTVTQDAFQGGIRGAQDGFLMKIDMAGSGAVDTLPPAVALNSPRDGSVISNNFSVSGTASDNLSVIGVRFTLDNKDVVPEINRPPYNATFDSTTFPNGQHTLSMLARDAAGNVSSQSIGVTVNNPVDFSLSVSGGSPSSITILAGQFARYELLLRTISGIPGVVSFSCTGLPAGAQCTFLPKTLDMINGGGDESVFINTTAPAAASSAAGERRNAMMQSSRAWLGLAGAFLAGLLLLPRNARRHRRSMLPAMAMLGLALFVCGCGGGTRASNIATPIPTPSPTPTASSATPPGTYTVTVIASATGAIQTLHLQLIVK